MYCYIFGALPVNEFNFKINDNDIVIAADAGLKNIEKFNISPDYIIGDFDSLGYKPDLDNTIVHPIEKDDTDTLLAIKKAFDLGYKNFRVFGCTGGRLDHTLANVQAASFITNNCGKAIFYGDSENFTVIKNDIYYFDESNAGNISIFALTSCNNVCIKGLYYELDNVKLTPDFPLGVSNKFINKKAEISVENGKLLIIWDNNEQNIY